MVSMKAFYRRGCQLIEVKKEELFDRGIEESFIPSYRL
jgi:hypothetical protein